MKSFKFFIVLMMCLLLFCALTAALIAWNPNAFRVLSSCSLGVLFADKMWCFSAWLLGTKKEE